MHPTLRARAERQLSLFTASDARQAGYQHAEIRHLVSSGQWVRLRQGVYVGADDLAAVEGRRQRHQVDCLAVMLSLGRPRCALSHATAARLWGLPIRRSENSIIRLTDPDHWRKGEGYRMSRAQLPTEDVAVQAPFRLTSVARTLIDCGREWRLDDTVVAIDAALLAGRTNHRELQAAALAARYRPGAPAALRAVSLADGRAESPLETRGRLRIVGSGLPRPQLQVEIHAGRRLVGVVDAWFDDAAVAVEFDGRVKYTDPWRDPGRVLWDEKRREDELRSLGIHVVRIADEDLYRDWARIEARLRALASQPGPAERGFTAIPRSRGIRRVAGGDQIVVNPRGRAGYR